eukprot:4608900-Lingulodinium_polyedra.AAC.1
MGSLCPKTHPTSPVVYGGLASTVTVLYPGCGIHLPASWASFVSSTRCSVAVSQEISSSGLCS